MSAQRIAGITALVAGIALVLAMVASAFAGPAVFGNDAFSWQTGPGMMGTGRAGPGMMGGGHMGASSTT